MISNHSNFYTCGIKCGECEIALSRRLNYISDIRRPEFENISQFTISSIQFNNEDLLYSLKLLRKKFCRLIRKKITKNSKIYLFSSTCDI